MTPARLILRTLLPGGLFLIGLMVPGCLAVDKAPGPQAHIPQDRSSQGPSPSPASSFSVLIPTASHILAATGTDPRRDDLRTDEGQGKKIQDDHEKLREANNELRHERDLSHARAEDLQRRLETAQEELASNKKSLADAQSRIAALEKEREQLTAALGEARDQARDLGTKLAAEQVKAAALREDKQKLMAGTTTAKEEIARLQKREGELETEAVRATDLAKRLAERDQEIAKLRKAATEREALAGRMATLTDKLERTKQRVSTLTGELALLGEEAARMRQERDRLSLDIQKQQDPLRPFEANAGNETITPAERPRPDDAAATLRGRVEERPRPESPTDEALPGRDGRDALSPRLSMTLSELNKRLEADIARGDITIQRGRDRLTITLVERVLFDSGQAQIKPTGIGVLKQVSEILKVQPDRQIRVEGHTDNVPIGAKLKERFPTNWELSTARATSVVRYLLDEGGLDPANLSAVGFADTRPIASNDVEEGRMANRRIDIVMHPKEPAETTR